MRVVNEITGKTVSFVINSHFHLDHVVGNCLFPNTTPIISSKPTYDDLIANTAIQYRNVKEMDPKDIEKLEIQLKSEKDEAKLLPYLERLKVAISIVAIKLDIQPRQQFENFLGRLLP